MEKSCYTGKTSQTMTHDKNILFDSPRSHNYSFISSNLFRTITSFSTFCPSSARTPWYEPRWPSAVLFCPRSVQLCEGTSTLRNVFFPGSEIPIYKRNIVKHLPKSWLTMDTLLSVSFCVKGPMSVFFKGTGSWIDLPAAGLAEMWICRFSVFCFPDFCTPGWRIFYAVNSWNTENKFSSYT